MVSLPLRSLARRLGARRLAAPGAALALLALGAGAARAQQKPTTEQAQLLLQTRPDLVGQLQQKLATSGMTLDQLHARLRAEGYPENLLDGYYPGSRELASGTPSADVFGAVEALGITDELETDSLRVVAGYQPLHRRDLRQRGWVVDSARARRARYADPFDAPLEDSTVADRPRGASTRRSVVQSGAARGATETGNRRRGSGDAASGSVSRSPSPVPASSDTLVNSIDAPRVDSLRVFGLDVFERGSTQFEPNLAGPVDASYRLGPGDRLVLVLTGDVEASYTLDVTRQGFVVVPQVGQIDVANLTMGQLESVLYSRLGRIYSGLRRDGSATTHFSITPARLRSNQVYVIGDVAEPGSYRVSGAGTALTALYAAGGPTDVGSLRQVEIRRAGKVVGTVDMYDYLLRGDASRDARLENGDVVFVPVHGARVQIAGEVLRPAIYEVRAGETVADLVKTAGGFRAAADQQRVQIERIVPASQRQPGKDRVMIDVTAQQLASGLVPALADGDVVRVFPVPDRVRSQVVVRGNVWNPGVVGFASGMKLSDAIRLAGGPKPDSYLGQILVSRLRGDSTRVQLRSALRDTTGAVTNDFVLSDEDEIRIFSTTDFRPTRYVAVSGAVRRPGRYAYREGMTLRDLVLLAGGLEERVFLQNAEIARLPESHDGGRLATTVRVPLDSSYLFDRGADGHYVGAPGLPAPAGSAPEITLQPYDNVLLLEQPEWGLQRNVVVVGEVMYPGTYSLTNKSERLSDVLRRAGGLTREGNADGVVFYRKRARTGRIGVDLARVLRDEHDLDNLVLQDGDSISIPSYNGVVNVTGAVNSPVAVAYVPGASIDFYIAAAGGLSPQAELGRAYVTQPNGKVESRKSRRLLPDSKPAPRAGSMVVVPFKDPNDKSDVAAAVAMVGTIAQVLGSLVALAVVVHNTK